jgi:hypothetical protein
MHSPLSGATRAGRWTTFFAPSPTSSRAPQHRRRVSTLADCGSQVRILSGALRAIRSALMSGLVFSRVSRPFLALVFMLGSLAVAPGGAAATSPSRPRSSTPRRRVAATSSSTTSASSTFTSTHSVAPGAEDPGGRASELELDLHHRAGLRPRNLPRRPGKRRGDDRGRPVPVLPPLFSPSRSSWSTTAARGGISSSISRSFPSCPSTSIVEAVPRRTSADR